MCPMKVAFGYLSQLINDLHSVFPFGFYCQLFRFFSDTVHNPLMRYANRTLWGASFQKFKALKGGT